MRNSLRNNQWAWRKRVEQKESQENKKVESERVKEKETPKTSVHQLEMVN
jgi:hypothetical protein